MAQKELPIILRKTPLLCACSDDVQFNINTVLVSDNFPLKKNDSDILICAILNGTCILESEGKRYTLCDKNFAVIPAECDYRLVSVSELFLCFALGFDIKPSAKSENGFWNIGSAKHSELGEYQLNNNIKSIISNLKSEALHQKHDNESLIKIYLDTLLGEISRIIAYEYAEPVKYSNYGDARVEEAVRYIEENISANITSSNVAKHVFLSEKQLKRIFINTLGKSPTDYIRFCRYERACKLLKESEFSIFEIAEQSGFKDIKSFVEFFKRYSGKSPAKYRNPENK